MLSRIAAARSLAVLIGIWLLLCAQAHAFGAWPPDWSILFRPYVGGGASWTHHTGYDPDRPVHLEQWVPGAKAFGGIEITRWAAAEFGYYYLSSAPFRSNLPAGASGGDETSHAFSATALIFTDQWSTPLAGLRLFSRWGAAYKQICDDNGASLVQRESGFAYQLGGGLEMAFGPTWFARVEYEYISKIGADRAVNVQHTPISFVIGARF